jgi:hypothetical protein
MKKPHSPRYRSRIVPKQSALAAFWVRWIDWLEEPFQQLARLQMMIPQAKAPKHLILAEKREAASFRSRH